MCKKIVLLITLLMLVITGCSSLMQSNKGEEEISYNFLTSAEFILEEDLSCFQVLGQSIVDIAENTDLQYRIDSEGNESAGQRGQRAFLFTDEMWNENSYCSAVSLMSDLDDFLKDDGSLENGWIQIVSYE